MASDDFNRANENPINAPWTALAGNTGAFQINGNGLQKDAVDGNAYYYYSGAATTADEYSQVLSESVANDGGPAVRIGASGFSSYFLDYQVTNWLKHVSGSFSTLTSVGTTYANNDVLRIEVQGSTLRAFKNGVATPTPSMTDTSLTTAGNGVGMFIFNISGGTHFDNWSGGDLTAAAPWPLFTFDPVPFMSNQRI